MWKIKYDHTVVDNSYTRPSKHDTKAKAVAKLRRALHMFPYITASLFQKKDRKWMPRGRYKVKESRKTGRLRLVKL